LIGGRAQEHQVGGGLSVAANGISEVSYHATPESVGVLDADPSEVTEDSP
jgi:hypothetical protein